MIEPKILLLDEAVSALDPITRKNFLSLLQKLRAERQLSIVFVSHDLSVLRGICDRLMIMEHGKIVDEGTPKEFFEQSLANRAEITRKLIEAIPEMPDA